MAPKTIATREEILSAAMTLVRNQGMESVNARSVANLLGCSTKPLFRIYKNMEELKSDVFLQINRFCSEYLCEDTNFVKNPLILAMNYIKLAREEPHYFKTLFMSNSITQSKIINMFHDQDVQMLLNEISRSIGISMQKAQAVYQKMWLLSHGIASIVATNNNTILNEEAENILSDAYKSFLLLELKEE